MPKNKKPQAPPPEVSGQPETPEVQQKKVFDMLTYIKGHMDKENGFIGESNNFQGRTGKGRAIHMNKKEKAEHEVIIKKNYKTLLPGQMKVNDYLNEMKAMRSKAINEAKRRGEFNAIEMLKLRHGCLPIWDPSSKSEPFGAGGYAWPDNKKLQKDDEVAAFVEESKTWIMAEVVGSVSNHRYECIDIDDEERKVAVFARKQLIPMPQYTVHYCQYPNLALPKNAIVLALFPNTTCFYEGIVHEPPKRASEHYQIRFVDNDKPSKYSDPVPVSDRYVTAFKKDPIMYIRPAKRVELGLEEPKEISPSKQNKKKKKKEKQKNTEQNNVIDEKDVPGPAPKAPTYYESPDETAPVKKQKPRKKSAEPKVKIIRAKVPEHKKHVSTRQFGKRKVKRKPKNVVPTSVDQVNEPSDEVKPEEKPETERMDTENTNMDVEHNDSDTQPQSPLTGLARYGLEDEREETESEEEEEKNEDDGEQEEEKEEEEVDDEEDEETETQKEEKDNTGDDEEEEEETREPHDPEEGTSSGPRHHGFEIESDSDEEEKTLSSSDDDSSDALSGLTISDHERDGKGINSDHEPEL
ncbi:hypothetical protein CRE_00228 [Caenorhabditis remanei]|uniref:Uncharacterized protein n=1 Tax=Caenorhabditis remanei TaxID=31234 RepID=E3LDX2_CAERE|nr:hypothetical protein CRE_00228 [Caenorhabditis remanei]